MFVLKDSAGAFRRAAAWINCGLIFMLMHSSTWAVGRQDALSDEKKPLVISSIRPLQLIVDEIAGDLIDSRVLISGPASPHDFSLTIAQALVLNEADLLVWVGPRFEQFLRSGVHTKTRLSMTGAELESTAGQEGHDRSDQHVWLSQREVAVFSQALVRHLVKLLPENEDRLRARQQKFTESHAAAHSKNRQRLASVASTPFAVHHDAYGYLVDEYGLRQVLSLTSVPHERLSAKKLMAAGEGMVDAACLLSEAAEARQASRYAKLFEKPLVTVDLLASEPSTTGFDQYLERIGSALDACLRQTGEKKPAV